MMMTQRRRWKWLRNAQQALSLSPTPAPGLFFCHWLVHKEFPRGPFPSHQRPDLDVNQQCARLRITTTTATTPGTGTAREWQEIVVVVVAVLGTSKRERSERIRREEKSLGQRFLSLSLWRATVGVGDQTIVSQLFGSAILSLSLSPRPGMGQELKFAGHFG